MPYTKEQAEKDRSLLLRMANDCESEGDAARAGILRVEAENCLDRVGMKKAHRPCLGPYTTNRPCVCLDCGKFRVEWGNDDECVVRTRYN